MISLTDITEDNDSEVGDLICHHFEILHLLVKEWSITL